MAISYGKTTYIFYATAKTQNTSDDGDIANLGTHLPIPAHSKSGIGETCISRYDAACSPTASMPLSSAAIQYLFFVTSMFVFFTLVFKMLPDFNTYD